MNTKRLQHLITVLEKVAVKQERNFDMTAWTIEKGACGTAHCALGWAAVDPDFQLQGLGLDSYGIPIYRDFASFWAAQRFFGISHRAATYLFAPDQYENWDKVNPAQVISHIREVINGYLD